MACSSGCEFQSPVQEASPVRQVRLSQIMPHQASTEKSGSFVGQDQGGAESPNLRRSPCRPLQRVGSVLGCHRCSLTVSAAVWSWAPGSSAVQSQMTELPTIQASCGLPCALQDAKHCPWLQVASLTHDNRRSLWTLQEFARGSISAAQES